MKGLTEGTSRISFPPLTSALRPTLWTLAVLLVMGSIACERGTPVEPDPPVVTPTLTPTPTPTPAPPPAPTPLPEQSPCCALSDDLPRQLRRGQEFTFSVNMTGNAGIDQWERGTLVWTFLDGFIAGGSFVAFDGDSIGETLPSAETGGWDIVVHRAGFGPGSHIGFTARLRVKPDARLGYTLVGSQAHVWNTTKNTRSQERSNRFYIQILE